MTSMAGFSVGDAAAAVAWALVTAVLLASAWRFSGWAFPTDSSATRVLHTTILAWAVIVGAATLLGAIGALFPAALLAVVAALAVLLGWKGAPASRERSGEGGDLSGLILWGALMAFWAGHIVYQGLLRFPTDWDSLMYHLPLVDQWLQARSLYAPRDATWYNPGSNELLGLWLVAPFSGDFLIALNNVPAVTVLILGGVELARQFDLSRPLALCSALALVANHVVFRQITDAENDIAVAGLFLGGLGYAIRHAKTGRGADLAFAAAAIGLLAGVKYFALGYAAVVGASLVVATCRARGYRPAARALAVGLLGGLLLGGYWYVRNTVLTGTPIYPKGFTPSTDELSQFPGWHGGFSGTTLLGNGRPEVVPLTIKAVWSMAGPCHAVALCGLPVSVGWLIITGLWRRRSAAAHPGAACRLALVVALLGSWLIWSITPFAVETTPGTLDQLLRQYLPVRFGLSFLSLAVIALAIVAHDLGRALGVVGSRWTGRDESAVPLRVLAGVPALLLAAGASYQFVQQVDLVMGPGLIDGLLIGGNLALLGTIYALCHTCSPGGQRWLLAGSAVVFLGSFAWAAETLGVRWHEGFTPHYDRRVTGGTLSELNCRDPAATRLCVLSYRYYFFFGSHRQFQVARPLRLPTYESLRDYLLLHDLNVVVTTTDPFPNPLYRDQEKWINERPEVFRKIGDGSVFKLHEVDLNKLRAND